MGSNEQNYERLWALRQENEQRLAELAATRCEREDDPLAEAMRQPLEDPLARWRREQEAAPRPRQRSLDTSLVNWNAVIDKRIAAERAHLLEVIGEALGEV